MYFGTGESFVCRLAPSYAKYQWVGLTIGEKTPHSAQLFLSGDNTQIAIGGGFVGLRLFLPNLIGYLFIFKLNYKVPWFLIIILKIIVLLLNILDLLSLIMPGIV